MSSQNKTRYCPHCHTALALADSHKCSNCGKSLTAPVTASVLNCRVGKQKQADHMLVVTQARVGRQYPFSFNDDGVYPNGEVIQ